MENQRNMILAIVLSALVLFGWSALSDRIMPTANPPGDQDRERQADAGRDPRGPAGTGGQAIPPRRSPRTAARPDQERRAERLDQPTGAPHRDLVLTTYGRDDRQEFAAGAAASPSRERPSLFRGFGWTGPRDSVPDVNTVWTAERTAADAADAGHAELGQPAGAALRDPILSIDDDYMFTVTQAVTNGGAVSR